MDEFRKNFQLTKNLFKRGYTFRIFHFVLLNMCLLFSIIIIHLSYFD